MPAGNSKELEPDVATSPPGGVLDDSNKRAPKTDESRSGGGGGDGQRQGQQNAKKKRGRLVPGSLLLTSLSASALPNTEKGAFSKQVRAPARMPVARTLRWVWRGVEARRNLNDGCRWDLNGNTESTFKLSPLLLADISPSYRVRF